MKKYIIAYYGSSGNGYVDYNKEPCNLLDNAMTFSSQNSAEDYKSKLQEEWLSELKVEEVDL